jgi:esterase
MELFFRKYGSGPNLIVLHGLLGNGDNWATLGKQFGEQFSTFTPDMRNHGQSPHVAEMNYRSMAADVIHFMDQQLISNSHILGHSMGGKIAMQMALENSDRVEKLVVVDMGPKKYPDGHKEIFKAMFSLPIDQIQNRKEATDFLLAQIDSETIVQFLLKNIVFDKKIDGYKWRINLPGIYESYPNILEAIESDSTYEKPTLFIYGGNSDYVNQEDHNSILKLFPNTEFFKVENAGHWVHAEKPKELFNRVVNFLQA